MDLLLTFPEYLLIVEVKYISSQSATLSEFPHQLTRLSYEGLKKTFPDPILQVKQQRKQLSVWLRANGFPSMPIEYLVVMANPSCEVIIAANYRDQGRVIRAPFLEYKMSEFGRHHREERLGEEVLGRLDKVLLEGHRASFKTGIERYRVAFDEVKKGVHCPKCGVLAMERKHKNWVCRACGLRSNDAIIETLRDYYFMVGDTITNSQLRDFCCIETSKSATRIFNKLNLRSVGATKGRRYLLDSLLR